MRRLAFVFATLVGLSAWPVDAAELVSRAEADARLAQAFESRSANAADVRALLATPSAIEAARRVGVEPGRVRAAVDTLDDRDLADLATRARTLRLDPRAGIDKDIHDLLVLFLIIAIVILVLQAVD